MKQQSIIFKEMHDKTKHLDYLFYLPENYELKKEWPLILFLHGAGEVGSNIEKVKEQGLPKRLESSEDIPFVVISPQCPDHSNWKTHLSELFALINSIKTQYNIDDERVYLTGLSMGGFGTWALALKYPSEFAALVPICGGSQNQGDIKTLKDIPIWTFHGELDNAIPIELTQGLVEVLNECDGNIKFTKYPNLTHDSWTETYNNPLLYEWLLKQKRT